MQHRDYKDLDAAAQCLADMLKRSLGRRVLGPEYNSIPRMNNYYIKNIMIKIERSNDFFRLKSIVVSSYNEFLRRKESRGVRVAVDVDPM